MQPQHFKTVGHCTALHKSEVRRKKIEYFKKKVFNINFFSEMENAVVNIYYQNY